MKIIIRLLGLSLLTSGAMANNESHGCAWVMHDFRTQETRVVPHDDPAYLRLEINHTTGSLGGLKLDGMEWTFPEEGKMSSLYTVIASNFPYRMNAVGSGSCSLIDPKFAITAAHAVYDPERAQWQTGFKVYPGSEYPTSLPYGYATAIRAYIWTCWTEDGDYDCDLAVIELDRNIGAIVGWFGYGFNNDDSYFENKTFYQYGYPEECNNGTKYSMCGWNGTLDDVETYQLEAYLGTYDNLYTFSGAGLYYIDSGNRIICGALSHSYNVGTYNISIASTRITSSKFYDIRDDWIAPAHPSKYDLILLYTLASKSTLKRSEAFSASFISHNYSQQSYSGALYGRLYLSTDKTISKSDRLVGSATYTSTWNSLGVKTLTINGIVPPDLTPGTYYAGVMISFPSGQGDYISWNNITGQQDIYKITVQ